MNVDQFYGLVMGDVVKNVKSGDKYVILNDITENKSRAYIAAKIITFSITSMGDWEAWKKV